MDFSKPRRSGIENSAPSRHGYTYQRRCYTYVAPMEHRRTTSGESGKLSEELTTKPATERAALIQSRAVSPVEVVSAHLQRSESINPKVNAIVTLADDALDRARSAELTSMTDDAV